MTNAEKATLAAETTAADETDFATIKGKLCDAFNARADALGWRNKAGKLTKRGDEEALSFLIGADVALRAVGHAGLGPLVWVAAVRGVDAVLNPRQPREEAVHG